MQDITFVVSVKAPLYSSPERSFTSYEKARESLYTYMERARKAGEIYEAVGTITMVDKGARKEEAEVMRINGDFHMRRRDVINTSDLEEEVYHGVE